MRWIALILLLANAGLVAWQVAGSPGLSEPAPARPPEIGDLTLLRDAAGEPSRVQQTQCFTIGPFSDAEAAEEAAARMADLGVETDQRRLTDEETTGYQVILPPFDSREQAEAATRELEAAGVQDFFIITSDEELENAISLGLFSEQEFAVDHRETLEERGFEPELRLRTRTRVRYWQDFRDTGDFIDPDQIEAWVGDGPLQRLPRDC